MENSSRDCRTLKFHYSRVTIFFQVEISVRVYFYLTGQRDSGTAELLRRYRSLDLAFLKRSNSFSVMNSNT